MKHALIFDLDNTIYPVSSIADNLFAQLFKVLDEHEGGIDQEKLIAAKEELKRRPYHLVADKYDFDAELNNAALELLKNMTYDLPMQPFGDYHVLKPAGMKRFLVTTGFTKLQWSKIKMLDVEKDFDEIHIVDPETSKLTKKNVFAGIMQRHQYQPVDVLVIGDDPESEIRAANELGIDTFLFDPENMHTDAKATHKRQELKDVLSVLA